MALAFKTIRGIYFQLYEHLIVQVILFDLKSTRYKLEEWQSELWDLAHIGIPDSDTESQDSLIFGQLTCWFI